MDALLGELVIAASPKPRSRSWVFAGALLVGAIALAAWPHDGPDECTPPIDDWDTSARDGVTERFAATGLPYAAAASEAVDRELVAFTTQLRDEYAATCAPGVGASGPRLRCLEQARSSARALVDELLDTDASVIGHAAAAVSRLPIPSACASVGDGPADPEPEIAIAVTELRAALAAAQSRAELGRFTEARDAAMGVLADAETLGHAPLVAEARLAAGLHTIACGDAAAGEGLLAEAAWGASAAGHDRVVALAAIELVAAAGDGQGSHHDAETWARHAEVALDRLPDAPLDRARLADRLALVHERRGDYEEAAAHARTALALLERIEPAPELSLADEHTRLGDVSYLLGDYRAAAAAHEHAREIRERLLGPDHPDLATALNGLGLAAQAQGDIAGAIELHERALRIRERALGPDHPLVAATLTNLASARLADDDLDHARALFERSLAIKERVHGRDHPELISVLSNSGIVALEQRDFEGAKRLFARAVAIVEAEYGGDHPQLAAVLNNVGVLHAREGDNEAALATYERVLAIEQRALGDDHPRLASTHYNLGVSLGRLEKHKEALEHQRRALELFERTEGPSGTSTTLASVGIGDSLLALGEIDGAAAEYEHALGQDGVDAPSARALAQFGLARVAAARGEDHRARELAIEARGRLAALDRTAERDRVDAWLRR